MTRTRLGRGVEGSMSAEFMGNGGGRNGGGRSEAAYKARTCVATANEVRSANCATERGGGLDWRRLRRAS
jgi:hypothetical protein